MKAVAVQPALRRVAAPLIRPVRRRMLGQHRPWVVHEDNPAEPRRLASFRVFGVIGAWMEADIIEANVRNAFTQGCERVFLVDNASPDETVARAVGAGAELWCRFETPHYNEELRMTIMRELVHQVDVAYREPIWWMWLDADEFPHGPRGLTVRQYLATLDRRFRIVGTRYLNHYPTAEPHCEPNRHPLDYQPMCELYAPPNCDLGHRKHILHLHLPGAPAIRCGAGFHVAKSAERPLREPSEGIVLHHFPFRAEGDARARMRLLVGGEDGGSRAPIGDVSTNHMIGRARTLDAVYAQDWANVATMQRELVVNGAQPRPWTELVDAADTVVARWY